MNLNEYQDKANTFATDTLPDDYAFTNGASETGETLGKFAKFQRKQSAELGVTISLNHAIQFCKNPLTKEECKLRDDVKKELGDELWQLQRKAHVCGFTLEDIATSNIEKLSGRLERNTIVGSGDYR